MIVGAGGIGSRHLQALAQISFPIRVHVVDPSERSIEVAQGRWRDANPLDHHRVSFSGSCAALPASCDVAIVATPSLSRCAAFLEIMSRCVPRHVILEKFLFPDPADYETVAAVAVQTGTALWVNTPRRLWPDYGDLLERTDTDGPVTLHVVGSEPWGIGSNAVHFLDLLMFFTHRRGMRLSAQELVSMKNTRRSGHTEFRGTVSGSNNHGDHFGVTTLGREQAPLIVMLSSPDARVVVDESNGVLLESRRAYDWEWRRLPFVVPLQSRLTTAVVYSLAADDTCGLPTFEESAETHLALLGAFLEAYRRGVDPEADSCPVT